MGHLLGPASPSSLQTCQTYHVTVSLQSLKTGPPLQCVKHWRGCKAKTSLQLFKLDCFEVSPHSCNLSQTAKTTHKTFVFCSIETTPTSKDPASWGPKTLYFSDSTKYYIPLQNVPDMYPPFAVPYLAPYLGAENYRHPLNVPRDLRSLSKPCDRRAEEQSLYLIRLQAKQGDMPSAALWPGRSYPARSKTVPPQIEAPEYLQKQQRVVSEREEERKSFQNYQNLTIYGVKFQLASS